MSVLTCARVAGPKRAGEDGSGRDVLLRRPAARQSPVEESLMAVHKPLHLVEAKSADTRISRDQPTVARLNFSLLPNPPGTRSSRRGRLRPLKTHHLPPPPALAEGRHRSLAGRLIALFL